MSWSDKEQPVPLFFVGDGNAVPWWSQETIEAFTVQAQCFVDQYGNYSVPEIASIVGEENAHVLPFFYLLLSGGLWNFLNRFKILYTQSLACAFFRSGKST